MRAVNKGASPGVFGDIATDIANYVKRRQQSWVKEKAKELKKARAVGTVPASRAYLLEKKGQAWLDARMAEVKAQAETDFTGGEATGTGYRDARPHLVTRIGEYCSFCEQRVTVKIEVEHMAPKDVYPASRYAWENFLLCCGNCNPIKGTKHKVWLRAGGNWWQETTVLTYCFWPDRLDPQRDAAYGHDSFNVLQYREWGVITVHPSVPDGPTRDRVLATMGLVGLDRNIDAADCRDVPNLRYATNGDSAMARIRGDLNVSGNAPSGALMTQGDASVSVAAAVVAARDNPTLRGIYANVRGGLDPSADYRAFHRAETWARAERCRIYFDKLLVGNPKNREDEDAQALTLAQFEGNVREYAKQVVAEAQGKGFWSIWVTVFKGRGESDRFRRRPAIVPVLRRLLARFRGTRDNRDFRPAIYSRFDEGDWLGEIRRKEAQEQRRNEAEFNADLMRQQQVWALQDDQEMLQHDLAGEREARARAERERDQAGAELLRLRMQLAVAQDQAGRAARERNAALDEARRLRDERDHARGVARNLEANLQAAQRDGQQVVRERNQALFERNQAQQAGRALFQQNQQLQAQVAQLQLDPQDARTVEMGNANDEDL